MTSRTTPLELRAPRGADTLEIDFEDGHHAVYPHTILRGYCPCAICQGHQGPIKFVEPAPGPALELTDIAEVGDYALRLTWGDGHSTGIYTFVFLRELCACSECKPTDRTSSEYSR